MRTRFKPKRNSPGIVSKQNLCLSVFQYAVDPLRATAMQVLNYAEPNFCKIFRDLDLVVVQFAGLSCGAPQLINHVLHKCVPQPFPLYIYSRCRCRLYQPACIPSLEGARMRLSSMVPLV